ncbi:hypothetical protein QR680_018895 [Steinernema hermaphroditum]|uniref:Serine/threonine-protein phosphatase n=1 Tax=Steinernema hermaphroditum TaxID=289476 RepID=A0AA39HJC9_9BILA|nr:hypothetical protein QR680_018895 [Steinernema hermaphroditum]
MSGRTAPSSDDRPMPSVDAHAPNGDTAMNRAESDEAGKRSIIKDDLDVDNLIYRLLNAGSPDTCLTKVVKRDEIIQLCRMAKKVFESQSAMLELEPPVKICGDIHGQYGDLLRLFDCFGFPPTANYLFLGDYVDRGGHCLETICLLFAYKIKYPENFFLLRGNHEIASINILFGFYGQVLERYQSVQLFNAFQDTFRVMPLTALISARILCMHGGLSKRINSIDDLRKITVPLYVRETEEKKENDKEKEKEKKKKDEEDNEIYTMEHDLLWADPNDKKEGWGRQERRGALFGSDIVDEYVKKLNIDLIVRAHQAVRGYRFSRGDKLITIFSAPNYIGENYNEAGVLDVNEKLKCSLHLIRPWQCAEPDPKVEKEEEEDIKYYKDVENAQNYKDEKDAKNDKDDNDDKDATK